MTGESTGDSKKSKDGETRVGSESHFLNQFVLPAQAILLIGQFLLASPLGFLLFRQTLLSIANLRIHQFTLRQGLALELCASRFCRRSLLNPCYGLHPLTRRLCLDRSSVVLRSGSFLPQIATRISHAFLTKSSRSKEFTSNAIPLSSGQLRT